MTKASVLQPKLFLLFTGLFPRGLDLVHFIVFSFPGHVALYVWCSSVAWTIAWTTVLYTEPTIYFLTVHLTIAFLWRTAFTYNPIICPWLTVCERRFCLTLSFVVTAIYLWQELLCGITYSLWPGLHEHGPFCLEGLFKGKSRLCMLFSTECCVNSKKFC